MTSSRMKFFLMMVLMFVVLVPVFGQQMQKGPYLIYPGQNTQMTVLWQLDRAATCTLQWGTDTGYADGSVQTAAYGNDNQHRYVISNLTPGTRYYYRVNVGGTYHTGSFTAAPSLSVTALKFLAFGDTRSYPADHDAVAAQMVNTLTADTGYQTFSVHVGDWVNNGDNETDWRDEYFPRDRQNILGFQSMVPVMGCMGNHEYAGLLFQKYFPYPFVNDRYFSFDYGPVHVVVLDQYVAYGAGSAQLTWLTNDLANTDREWKVIVLHEPGWSAGGHANDADVQNHIQPLCEAYGVDIVFCGHNHYYARCEVNGVQHITVGGGGAPLYAPNYNAEFLVTAAEIHHHGEIEINGETLNFIARDRNGSVIDTFSASHVFVPALPWSDGFESGNLSAGGWSVSGSVDVVTDAYSGAYAARTDRSSALTKSVSTESFTNVRVKYARKTFGLDEGEYLLVEWYDGSVWHPLEQTQAAGWEYVDYACPAGADDNRLFKVRFSAVNADKREYAYIDAVEVYAGTAGPDTTPPSPDPMAWNVAPVAVDSASITMTAATAVDSSGVEYYFQCVSGGGHDSGWQSGPVYEDTGLTPDTTYSYRVKARDKSAAANETGFSPLASATTSSVGGNECYVADISISLQKTGPNYAGTAVVTMKDDSGATLAGVTVEGNWSGSVSGAAQGVTGADGTVGFTSPKQKGGGTFTFTVTGATKSGYVYNPALNVETSDTVSI